ncbi:hypothetical protein [Halorhabdus rudnickae]|uniref:hypothetical protein n=1 Tax=Halorhabdus rudnickae TaxID=1775544 RepID=UPI0010826815|nr:hypothetical protein [Halorhabdus rudnickae]
MTESASDPSPTEVLENCEVGDEIVVSARKTPMTVAEKTEMAVGGVSVEAKNHHGRYRLRAHGDGTVSFKTGGKLVDGAVEVSLHE